MSSSGGYSQHVRQTVVSEFEKTWRYLGSPTRAATVIAHANGVSKTTAVDWLREAGKWPTTRVSAALKLQEEVVALRKENQQLKAQLEQLGQTVDVD